MIDRMVALVGLERIDRSDDAMPSLSENDEDLFRPGDDHMDIPGILDYSELPSPAEWRAWNAKQAAKVGVALPD